MSLNDKAVSAAKPGTKTTRLYDSGGLYLEVSTTGSKYWRLKYRFAGKEKRLALGVYPTVKLKDARRSREAAKKLLHDGIDPSEHRKVTKATIQALTTNSFEAVARLWFSKNKPTWKNSHSDKIIRRLEREVFPFIGSRPIRELEPKDIRAVLTRIESRGVVETAHRVLMYCSQIFRYAVASGLAERDQAADLRGALGSRRTVHHASITEPKAIGELLRAIDGYTGQPATRAALQLAPLLFVRPGELRQAEWAEIDLDIPEWRIPKEKMKSGFPHIVPLSTQAIAIFEELRPLTGHGKYVFPGERSRARPMSENTINAALRRLGYAKTEMTGHGFRSMASTRLNEMGFNKDHIERQLAHVGHDPVRSAYNYAQHLADRIELMQSWADYLDGLRGGADVVAIKAKR